MMGPAVVMVVEDDEATRFALGAGLSSAGFDVLEAGDAETALKGLDRRESLPDLVLLDLTLPLMSGYELLARLRSDPRLRDIPVVVITGAPYDSRLLPSEGYHRKPVPLDDIVATARYWCRPSAWV